MSADRETNRAVGSFDHLKFLTSAQAARYLQVSRRTLDRLRARKIKLGAVKIGGQVRYHKDMLDEYLRKRADK
jgi:excisionase family DNA binding protein